MKTKIKTKTKSNLKTPSPFRERDGVRALLFLLFFTLNCGNEKIVDLITSKNTIADSTILPSQYGTGADGSIVITSSAGTVNIRDLYENATVTGVTVNGVINTGLNHCDSCNGVGATNYDPQNGRFINAKTITIEAGATLTATAWGAGTDNKLGIIWIATTNVFTNNGTIDLNGKGGVGGAGRDGGGSCCGNAIYAGWPGKGTSPGLQGGPNYVSGAGGVAYGSPINIFAGLTGSNIPNWSFLYGSGGGSGVGQAYGISQPGGSGGGAVRIYALSFNSFSGNVYANGTNGTAPISCCGTVFAGGSGGGSGGTIYIETFKGASIGTDRLGSTGGAFSNYLSNIGVHAGGGGGGGNAMAGSPGASNGTGGSGSVGRIHIEGTYTGSTSSPAIQ